MAHVQLPPPDHQEMIKYCIERFKTYYIFTGNDGRFYESDNLGCRDVPVNHVKCMLARDLHAQFFVTSKVRKVIVDKVIEAIFKWAEVKGKASELRS
jgi:hypothetical protein